MDEDLRATYDTLGVGEFPAPVAAILDDLDWGAAAADLKRVLEYQLPVETVPSRLARILRNFTWEDDLHRQLLGTVCTFLYYERDHPYEGLDARDGPFLRFDVATFEDGRRVSLMYPGYKNRFDYDVRVDDWYPDAGRAQSPRHWHLFSDYFWKLKQAHLDGRETAAAQLFEAITAVYGGAHPDDAYELLDHPDAFTVGRDVRVLLHVLPWFFIEEDLNYPFEAAAGRAMPYEPFEALAALDADAFTVSDRGHCPFSEPSGDRIHDEYHDTVASLPNYDADLQDNCEVVETPWAIEPACPRGAR